MIMGVYGITRENAELRKENETLTRDNVELRGQIQAIKRAAIKNMTLSSDNQSCTVCAICIHNNIKKAVCPLIDLCFTNSMGNWQPPEPPDA